jgi:hypothetical protein
MTQDDIIEMAIQCDCFVQDTGQIVTDDINLGLFAHLVAQHEREACAKIVENEAYQYTSPVWAFEIVNDIRARGQA